MEQPHADDAAPPTGTVPRGAPLWPDGAPVPDDDLTVTQAIPARAAVATPLADQPLADAPRTADRPRASGARPPAALLPPPADDAPPVVLDPPQPTETAANTPDAPARGRRWSSLLLGLAAAVALVLLTRQLAVSSLRSDLAEQQAVASAQADEIAALDARLDTLVDDGGEPAVPASVAEALTGLQDDLAASSTQLRDLEEALAAEQEARTGADEVTTAEVAALSSRLRGDVATLLNRIKSVEDKIAILELRLDRLERTAP